MIVVTSKNFKPVQWRGGSGTSYQNGTILDHYQAVIEFYIIRQAPDKRLYFNSADNTIKNANNIDQDSFVQLGFLVGEKIVIPEASINVGTFTITAVSDRVITVAETLGDELLELGNIFVDPNFSKITAIDYYFNLTKKKNTSRGAYTTNLATGACNVDNQNFISYTDADTIQKLTVSGLDPTVSTPVVFTIGSDSFGWVTETITGTAATSNVIGMGISGYKQLFKVVHNYLVSPFYLKDQFQNFASRKPVDYFLNDNCLSYSFQIDAKYDTYTAIPDHTVLNINNDGMTAWVNQNSRKTRPEYSFNSISYTDDATSTPVAGLQLTRVTDVTISINSLSGVFTDSGPVDTRSNFILDFLYCPNDETSYQNTALGMRFNYLNDQATNHFTGSAVNGVAYGTSYQVIKNFTCTRISNTRAQMNFKVDFSSFIKTTLGALDDTNRYYAIMVTAENITTSESASSDRVKVLCDFKNLIYNKDEIGLLTLVDYIHCYNFPDQGLNPYNNVADYEGQAVYCDVPFLLDYGTILPTLRTCRAQIVATKAGKQDFILEERIFNLSKTAFVEGAQYIDISTSRGMQSFDGDLYNLIYLQRASQYDTGTQKGYVLHYPFVLRYDYWVPLQTLVPGVQYDILEDNPTVTNRWADIAGGWSLKFRFSADVIGTNGYVTTYQADAAITIKKQGEAPDAGPVLTPTLYFLDDNDQQIGGIQQNGVTKVIAFYAGDFSTLPAGTDRFAGVLFADMQNSIKGGVNQRRVASTDQPSEQDSPWSAPEKNPDSDYSWADGNARIDVYGTTGMTVSSYYTQPSTNSNDALNCPIVLSVGGGVVFVPEEVRVFKDGDGHSFSDTSPLTFK